MRFNGLAVLAQAAKGVEVVPRCSGAVLMPWAPYALAHGGPREAARPANLPLASGIEPPHTPRIAVYGPRATDGTPRPHVQALTAHALRFVATGVAKRGSRRARKKDYI